MSPFPLGSCSQALSQLGPLLPPTFFKVPIMEFLALVLLCISVISAGGPVPPLTPSCHDFGFILVELTAPRPGLCTRKGLQIPFALCVTEKMGNGEEE